MKAELQATVNKFISFQEVEDAWHDYRTYRTKEIKAGWYANAKREAQAIANLYKLASGDAKKAKEIIEQTTVTSKWIALYPLKEERQNTQSKNYKQNQYELAKKVISDRDGLSF